MKNTKIQEVTVKDFMRIAMANNSTSIKLIAEKVNRTEAAVYTAVKRNAMNLKTLSKILEAMDEEVVLTLKNGQSYKIIIE